MGIKINNIYTTKVIHSYGMIMWLNIISDAHWYDVVWTLTSHKGRIKGIISGVSSILLHEQQNTTLPGISQQASIIDLCFATPALNNIINKWEIYNDTRGLTTTQ